MRTFLAATAALLVSLVPSSPATAANEDLITGTVTIGCFGCGYTTGTADLLVNGTGSATATFDVYQEPSLCPARGFLYGTISGYYNGTIYLEHDGFALYVSIEDTRGGTGGGVFKFAGNPCGQSYVTADVVAAIAGV